MSEIDMESICIANHVPCTVALVRKIRHLIEQLLLKAGEPQSVIDDTLLAVSEHLANLARHTDKTACSVYWSPKERQLRLSDNGPNVEELWQSVSSLESLQSSAPQTSGMGMALIASLFPGLSYQVSVNDTLPYTLILPLAQTKPKVAVIDDDPTMLMLVEAFLEEQYEPRQFPSVEDVLASPELADFQLFICDVHMPTQTGPELRQILLRNEATEFIPFIFLTGDATEDGKLQASHLQIDDYLTKPIDKTTLLITVERVLNRSSRLQLKIASKLDSAISRSLWPSGPWALGQCEVNYEFAVAERGGGDFLFSKCLPDRMRFVLGDVMGHGEQAKFYAFAISGYLTGVCESLSEKTEPSDFLESVSKLMGDSSLLERTMATFLVIDVFDSREVRISSAGHPPPILLQPGLRPQELAVSGALPGLSVGGYEQITLHLPEGAGLFCYTDGLVEALLFAEDATPLVTKLEEMVSKGVSLKAEAMADAFALTTRQLDDDVALLTIV
jgi:DNA-binding response OmpR family regulator/anti-sigma regulatory factor (Ser/Thr protein kinase)